MSIVNFSFTVKILFLVKFTQTFVLFIIHTDRPLLNLCLIFKHFKCHIFNLFLFFVLIMFIYIFLMSYLPLFSFFITFNLCLPVIDFSLVSRKSIKVKIKGKVVPVLN
jgi:hypothetical protein